MLWLVTRTDRTSVSTLMRCAWRTVTSIVTRAVDALIDSRRLENLYRIGVDEICYRHPHKYLTIVGDHDTGKVVYITEGRGRDSFSEFFEQQSAKERDKVQVVSMDGSPAFRAAAEDHVPRARQCMDPFMSSTRRTHATSPPTRTSNRCGFRTLKPRPRTVPAPCSTPGCGCWPADANGCTAMWPPGTRTSIIIGRSTIPIPPPEVRRRRGTSPPTVEIITGSNIPVTGR